MTLKHIGFLQSETLRELERQSVKKGHFEPTPEEIVQAAVEQRKKERKIEPTEDLFVDIMNLAEGLREKGYKKQAAELEKKLVILKSAEKHLYHVHEEEGDDLLDFAYPGGDPEVAPAGGDLGRVETPQSGHKKLLDIVNKTPSGKSASDKIATAADKILKESQTTKSEQVRDENQKKVDTILGNTKSYLRQVKDQLHQSFPQDRDRISGELDRIGTTLHAKLDFERASYDAAAKKLADSALAVKSLLNSLKAAPGTQGMIAHTTLPQIIQNYNYYIVQSVTAIQKMIPGDRQVDKAKISEALKYYSYSKELWDRALRHAQTAEDISEDVRAENEKAAAANLEMLGHLMKVLDASARSGTTLFALMRALHGKVTIRNEDDLIQRAKEWALQSEQVVKGANQDDAPLEKFADWTLQLPKAKMPPRPSGLDKPTGVGRAPQGKAPGKPVAAPAGRPTDEERQQVSMMQRLMSDFAVGLSTEKERLAPEMQETNPQELAAFAGKISDTGAGTANKFDGMWGPKTIAGLDTINVVLNRASSERTRNRKFEPVDVGGHYKKLEPQDVIAKAKSNTNKIVNAMGTLGLSKYVKTEVPGRVDLKTLDTVQRSLNPANVRTFDQGELPVREFNLSSLINFYNYLYSNDMTATLEAPRRASEIIDERLLSIAQIIRESPYGGGEVEAPAKEGFPTISGKEFDTAIRWFHQRAYLMFNRAQSQFRTREDIAPAQQYVRLMDNLTEQWRRIRHHFYDEKTGQWQDITLDNLIEKGGTRPGVGRRPSGVDTERPSEQEGVGIAAPSAGKPGADANRELQDLLDNAPLGPMIDVYYLADRFGGGETDSEWYRTHSAIRDLSYRDFSGTYPAVFWRSVMNADQYEEFKARKVHPGKFVNDFLARLGRDINIAYNDWRRRVSGYQRHASERLRNVVNNKVREQSRWKEEWLREIDRMDRANKRWIPRSTQEYGARPSR